MRKLLALALFLTSATIFAQGTLTGTVIDSETDGPLPGATVMVVGTTRGTNTDFDGNFSLNVRQNTGTLRVSFIGYKTKEVPFTIADGGTEDLGDIILVADDNALSEIVVTSYSLAIDRKTPVAVSTIKAEEIETKLGNQEFPEILNSTPSVYVTKGGGGFGDAQMRMRGFSSDNIAVMINGVPVNDMENGAVYWSNWAGLSDVTRTMQVQRGLGAAKVAVPSIGGTVNIVTKTTDAEKGGNVMASTGNDGYQKFGATVSTGLMDNGWAATVSASKTSGERFADGLQFEGYNYFLSVAKKINEDHELSFTMFGAPQRHGQRETQYTIEDYERSDRGIKFNGDWGYLNGQVVNIQDNYYHKPQISLNHYWNISDNTELSTSAYVSFGTGGGGGYAGDANLRSVNSSYRSAPYEPINLDLVVAENVANGIDGSGTIFYNSVNNHNWYGILSTLSTRITDDIELMTGLDLRYYKGEHYQEVKDLLGGQYWADDSNANDPTYLARTGDKINYYNDGIVLWQGVFAQAEYSKDDFSAFLALSGSNTSNKRIDYFTYEDSDPMQETDFENFLGFMAKGGANYNITDNHNVFANIGYFERAPDFDAVFPNNENIVNPDAVNEKIFSIEAGYGFRSPNLRVDLNLYRTQWLDKTQVQSIVVVPEDPNEEEQQYFGNLLGVDALHQGVELEFEYRPWEILTIDGMFSYGDWRWSNDVLDVQFFDENQDPIEEVDLFIEDTPVGNQPQTSMALGVNAEVLPRTFLRGNFNYFSRMYAQYDPSSRNDEDIEFTDPWEVPDYGIFDVGLTHNFSFGAFDATINANVFNLLDTQYISDATDGTRRVEYVDANGQDRVRLVSNAQNASVYYGFGRTYTVGMKINF
ncbi:TonB-dependent receptor [Zunongwangia sp. F363]|uniref:TonB-dependent receptor n=1 Tax=Autumnicola tepida TaxID=3075595 RepID=A0ABU3C6S0_9FLAO|nr:carboxypeptidase-like regulatory domain-containing protein [Zunongwangia sp. F363]MDT0642041.1 TonB-dependent receptor [Zunongwangia sp. F363]